MGGPSLPKNFKKLHLVVSLLVWILLSNLSKFLIKIDLEILIFLNMLPCINLSPSCNVLSLMQTDRSGTLDYREIHTALQSSGFTIGLAPTQLFFNKVSRGSAHINFPQFLQLGADIALLRSKFEWSDTDKDGVIHINFGQLLEICADL